MYTFKQFRCKTVLGLMFLAVIFGSCIENNIPYPWVMPNVAAIEIMSTDAEGHELLASPIEIDSVSRSIVIPLTEWADIYGVVIESMDMKDGSKCVTPGIIGKPLDLSKPIDVVFERYQREFTWTITATQTIDRYFTVASQIGNSVIDVENHTVTAVVPTAQSIENLPVRTLKLGGPYAVMTPDLVGHNVNFSEPVEVTVSEFERNVVWTLNVSQTDVNVNITSIDAWSNVAWVYVSAAVGKDVDFEYRKADAEDWIIAPSEWVTVNGGEYYARLIHLESQTAYVVRAVSDGENSAEMEFVTEDVVQLPNSSFTEWKLKDNKIWNPGPWVVNDEGKEENAFWDSGNRGAATLGKSITVPIDDPSSSNGYQGAMLQSKFVGASVLGKFGAGNLFAGSYVRTDGTDGVLSFGRPFNARPTKLKARIKYEPVNISHASKVNPDFQEMIGRIDTCIVWCALADWDQPYEIRTKKSDRHLFEADNPGVIAYGEFTSYETMQDYIDVEIPLNYRSTSRVPKYILVTASASKLGDYFTGGSGSVLYVKEYELIYDY
ncbi:MAG: PCMD domain-containing protein [Paramuribaculum sp.]|nr:PCMD domain-containing protein [Paramuribaculum sp.]